MTNSVQIDTTVIYPYAHAAFAAGYALYGPDTATEIAKHVCHDILEFAADHIHDTNVLKFVEAKGEQQGLFDALYLRRDRLWMKYEKQSQSWVRQFSQDVPADKVLDVVRRFDPMTESKDHRKNVKEETLAILLASLQSDQDLHQKGRQLVNDALTEGAAEGNSSATALIQQLVGKHLPDLDDLHNANLKKIKTTNQHAMNADFVLKTQMSGLAGDLTVPISTMMANGDKQTHIEKVVRDIIAKGDGSSFYLDGAIHGAYTQAQLNTYERSGSDVDFVTVGDDHVCATCAGYEDKNPWKVADVPTPPVHGRCRCWLAPAGTIS